MIDPSKRIAILLPDLTVGGAERATFNLVQGMARRGYPLDLVLSYAKGPLLENVSESVRVVDLHASRLLYSLPALVRYLKREQPHSILSIMNHTSIICLLARRLANVHTKVFVSVRNSLSNSVQNASHLRGKQMARMINLFFPWADGIITVSKGVADDLAMMTDIPRERIQVIYNPIITPEFKEKVQAPLDHPWFKPGMPPVVLGVGRLVIQKDFPTLIQAFAQVRRKRAARLMILGEGIERPSLEALVNELDLKHDVSMPGLVTNPYPYMTRASLFVLSSRWEGLPGVLIEALYCGVPLISTDCPSGPREILADGKYGQLVSVGDVNAHARAIESALDRNIPEPPPESWQPFELESVLDQMISTLL